MKKLICMVLMILSVLLIYNSVYAEESNVDTVKIGLFYGSSAKDSIAIRSESGFILGTETDGVFYAGGTLDVREIVATATADGNIAIGEYTYTPEQFPSLYPVEGNIFIGNTEYRGGVQFKRINGGALTVINVVNLEQYLYSVIGKEMSPSWPIEALKAQAVCARGFAISNRNKFAKHGFNLDDTTASQVYKGVSAEAESTRQAVDETCGQVLMYGGGIIESIYCSCTGGATANAENVWGGSYPYLTSVVDIYENPDEVSRYSWSITLTADEIKECLAKAEVDIGDIKNVEIVSADDAGYVLELLFTGTTGTHTVKKSSCRTVFRGKLHSQRYTILGGEDYFENMTVLSSGGAKTMPFNEVYVMDGGASNTLYVQGAEGTRTYAPTKPAGVREGEFTFNGNGWGHGVGMSQWGAKAMADMGFVFGDILTFYYTGTNLEKLY